ncbi:MAG: 5-deoxy-glucuronate isomerase [Spirochaetales bacterium]|nr:5-deoxy-glucuronate isomerase [Spirochaetales bacterium]
MPRHIRPYDNENHAVVDRDDAMVPRTYFNVIRLKQGEQYCSDLNGYESVCVPLDGHCNILVGDTLYSEVGKREDLFQGKPEGVYVPTGSTATITAVHGSLTLCIAGGRSSKVLSSFVVRQEDVDTVQYGSDETKTHRKIHHILGASQVTDRLLVSELFTVGEGGWSGFPPHKHDADCENESAFEEVYYFRFHPSQGFGAQFAYVNDDDFGPVHHIKDGSVMVLDKGYHPVVVAPGYQMYYFTILVGKNTRTLKQNFEEKHAHQLNTIPGIGDMIKKFRES